MENGVPIFVPDRLAVAVALSLLTLAAVSWLASYYLMPLMASGSGMMMSTGVAGIVSSLSFSSIGFFENNECSRQMFPNLSLHASSGIVKSSASENQDVVRGLNEGTIIQDSSGIINNYGLFNDTGTFINGGSFNEICNGTANGPIGGSVSIQACATPVILTPSDSTFQSANATILGYSDPLATIEIMASGNVIGQANANSFGEWTVITESLSPEVTLSVRKPSGWMEILLLRLPSISRSLEVGIL